MDKKRMETLCRQGDKADAILKEGRAKEALKAYAEIANEIEKSGELDSYLCAKVALGVLRSHVKLGDFKNAFNVWNASIEDSLFGVGIYALESAQTTVRDMVNYDMLCAFLHTLADNDPKAAGLAVNQYLSRVCEQATEDGDRTTMKLAISNWKQHMRDVFGGTIPHDLAKPLIHFEKSIGEPVTLQPIDFPAQAAWEKPGDFREMSRVAEMREIQNAKNKGKGTKKHRAS